MLWNGIILGYLALINLAAFLAVGWDKRKAKVKERHADVRRTPEKTLFFFGLLGGIIGMIAGMRTFRHKTRKLSFLLTTFFILVVNILEYYVIFNWLIAW